MAKATRSPIRKPATTAPPKTPVAIRLTTAIKVSGMEPVLSRQILVAGATGYIGSRLVPRLLARGHRVVALSRPASADRVPKGCEIRFGDACDPEAYASAAEGCDTLIHLVGVSHPGPSKAALFESVDLASARAAAYAARRAGIEHVLYMSVAHPAPVMHAYIEARLHSESLFWETGIP